MRLWVQAQDFVPLDRFVHAQDEPGQKFIQAASDYARAVAGLVDPVRQRFGETGVDHMRLKFPTEAEAAKMMAEMGDRSYAMIDGLTVTIHNDEATVGDGDPKHETLKLHKIDAARLETPPSMWTVSSASTDGTPRISRRSPRPIQRQRTIWKRSARTSPPANSKPWTMRWRPAEPSSGRFIRIGN